MIIEQIEQDILKEFLKYCPELKDAVDNSLKNLQSIKREFTGVGVFAEFIYKENFDNLESQRYSILEIRSKEFEHPCWVDIIFYENGLINYIEIGMGMREYKYPKEYEFGILKSNVIIDIDD